MFKKLTITLLIFLLLPLNFLILTPKKVSAETNTALFAAMTLWDASSGLPQGWSWNLVSTPLLYTTIPLDETGQNNFYVVFADDDYFYISKDKKFNNPATSDDERARPGDFITFDDEDAQGQSIIKDEMDNIISQSGKYVPFVGRTFVLGWVDWKDTNNDLTATFPNDVNGADPNDVLYDDYYPNGTIGAPSNTGDVLLLFEILDTTKTYNGFFVTDTGRMVLPKNLSALNNRFPATRLKIGNSVFSFNWVGNKFSYVKVGNISLNYRGTLPFEIWYDNGLNLVLGGPTLPLSAFNDTTDNYSITENTTERYLGAIGYDMKEVDYGNTLYSFPSNYLYYDVTGDGAYSYKEAVYIDVDGSNDVSVGDIRVFPVNNENGAPSVTISYPAGSYVQSGDQDLGYSLTSFTTIETIDVDLTVKTLPFVDWNNPTIYLDNDGDLTVSANDIRISGYRNFYAPGSTVNAYASYIFNDPVDFGSYNDLFKNERFLRSASLVGVSKTGVSITINGVLKVENTVDIKIKYKPNIRGWVSITYPNGLTNSYLIPSTGEVELQWVLLSRGGYLTIRVFAENVNADGLLDGVYGTWNNRIAPVVVDNDIGDIYDFYFIQRLEIKPEDLEVYSNRECIHPYDTRYPNIEMFIKNKLQSVSLGDPWGKITGDNLYAVINASTSSNSIKFLATATMNSLYYFIQYNEKDKKLHVWLFNDVNGNGIYDGNDTVNIAFNLTNAIYDDVNENKMVDNGDIITSGIYTFTILHEGIYSAIDSLSGKIGVIVKGTGYPCEDIKVEIALTQVIYDYWNVDPNYYYIFDPANPSDIGENEEPPHVWVLAKDYVGYIIIKSEPIQNLNFVNFEILDLSLMWSNYPNPYPPYGGWADLDNDGIADPNEMANNTVFISRWLRAYPGGQIGVTGWGYHIDETGRFFGAPRVSYDGYTLFFTRELNARWAQFSFLDKNPPYKNYLFEKLGTALHPLTSYQIKFNLTDKEGNPLDIDEIRYIHLWGEKKSETAQHVFVMLDSKLYYNSNYWYLGGRPIKYLTNNDFLFKKGKPYPYDLQDYYNSNNRLFYFTIIPTSWGTIRLEVEDIKGNKNEYKYCSCCFGSPPGIPVIGIEINDAPKYFVVDEEIEFTVQLKEYSTWQTYSDKVNNALVFIWQDRGIYDPESKTWYGVMDGWISGAPYTLQAYNNYVPYPYAAVDFNKDGKISFYDGETEILGIFDIDKGHWVVRNDPYISWVVEQTFQVNDGKVTFKIKPDTVGFDLDENGLIDRNEEIPIRITAYQFANDGSFSYYSQYGWMLPNLDKNGMPIVDGSLQPWEVFIAGEAIIPVVPKEGITINVNYEKLTAGIQPECIGEPLTFTVNTDLKKGVNNIEIKDDDIFKYLFEDPHPSEYGDFYWLRTDLQNTDIGIQLAYYPDNYIGISSDNVTIYNNNLFKPISYERKNNIYKFYGFVANDKGEFYVYVFSPDRKTYGKVKVVVDLPQIKWTISDGENIWTPDDGALTIGGPRLYHIKGKLYDALGNEIKLTCSGECESVVENCPVRVTLFTSYTPKYPIFFKIDKKYLKDPLQHNEWYYPSLIWQHNNLDDKEDYYCGLREWKMIYNNNYNYDEYKIGQLFVNLYYEGQNCSISSYDSIIPNCDGTFEFDVYPTDKGYISALVGINKYFDSNFGNISGNYTPKTENDLFVRNIEQGMFYLVWDAHADSKIEVDLPKFKLFWAETGEELSKDYLNSKYYDFVYGAENYIKIKAFNNYEKDRFPVEFQVQIAGNDGFWVYGTLVDNETEVFFKPHGTGTKVATLVMSFNDTLLDNSVLSVIPNIPSNFQFVYDDTSVWQWAYPCYFFYIGIDEAKRIQPIIKDPPDIYKLPRFDSARGLAISILNKISEIEVGKEVEVRFKVTVFGSKEPIQGAKVKVYGAGIDIEGVTDLFGEVVLALKPLEYGDIVVKATKDGFIPTSILITTKHDETPPSIIIDNPSKDTYLINSNILEVKGIVKDNVKVEKVLVNDIEATINEKGEFIIALGLKEGKNLIRVVAIDTAGNKSEVEFQVLVDTTPPTCVLEENTFVFWANEKEENRTTTLHWIISPDVVKAKVFVNDEEVSIANIRLISEHLFALVTLPYGLNEVKVYLVDKAGNENEILFDVFSLNKYKVELIIDSKVVVINGTSEEYEVAPFIKDGRTMVPLRLISEAFGAQIDWIPETKTVNITFKETIITLQVGNPTAIVNGKVIVLDVKPEIINKRVFVPIRFIAEAFGANVEWNYPQRKVIITLIA